MNALNGVGDVIVTDTVTVNDLPTAAFDASPRLGIAPLTVVFTNTATGGYTLSDWSFGDGYTSTLENPSHIYNIPGIYTVTLAIGGMGVTDRITKTNYISVYTAAKADFFGFPTEGIAPITVTFTNTSSGDFATSTWDFGDGIGSSETSPTHTYTSPGVYTVTLEVSGLGGVDVISKTGYITTYEAVQASFTATPTIGTKPLVVAFANTSTGDYDSCEWVFGDGGNSFLCVPLPYLYTLPGDYTVILIISGPGGSDTETKTDYIQVLDFAYKGYLPLIIR